MLVNVSLEVPTFEKAELIYWFFNLLGIMSETKTTQPNVMESTEEEPVHLPCNHSTISGNEYIHWYRQIPQQSPEYMIHGLKDNVTNGMATLIIAVDRKSSTLILPWITLRDAAVYYCIVKEAHWDTWGCTCTLSAWWGKGVRPCTRMSETQQKRSKEEKGKEVTRKQ